MDNDQISKIEAALKQMINTDTLSDHLKEVCKEALIAAQSLRAQTALDEDNLDTKK